MSIQSTPCLQCSAHLEPAVTAVSPRMTPDGWPFASVDPFPGAEKDPIQGASHLKELYLRVEPDYEGRCASR